MFGFIAALLVCCTMFLAASSAWAKGIFIPPGARSNSMGGAFAGMADDLSTLYWNPAGLTQLPGKNGAEVSLFFTNSNATSNTAPKNAAGSQAAGDFPLPRIYGAEPASYTNKELATQALIPFAAGFTRWNDITFAMGFYGTGGGGGKWDDTVSGTHAMIDSLQGFTSVNLSAAKEAVKNLSVGLSVELITSFVNQKVEKDYSNPLSNPGTPAYLLQFEKNTTGNGVQVSGSALYRIADNMRAGAIIRSGTAITMKGTAKLRNTSVLPFPANFSTNYEQKYIYPMTAAVGFSYDPLKTLTLTVQLDQNFYSQLKDEQTTYTTPVTGVFNNTSGRNATYKDTTQWRLGAEYRPVERWSFRAGMFTDPNFYDITGPNLFDTNQYAMLYAMAGASYYFKTIRIDLAYTRATPDKPELGGRTYDFPITSYRLGASYGF